MKTSVFKILTDGWLMVAAVVTIVGYLVLWIGAWIAWGSDKGAAVGFCGALGWYAARIFIESERRGLSNPDWSEPKER